MSRVRCNGQHMIVLGVLLLIIGFATGTSVIWTIGIILLVAGAALAIAGRLGHAIGGRKHWF